MLALYPTAKIREAADFPGSLGVNQGSGNGGFISNANGLSVTVDGETTIYDFEQSGRAKNDRGEDKSDDNRSGGRGGDD